MAQAFNLTAKINLQGPYNLRPIVSKIKREIGAIKPELKFKLDASAAKSVKNVTAEIKKLDAAAKNAKKSVGSLNSSLQTLSASFNTAANSSKNAANATAAVTKATSSAAKSANQARTAIEEFGKQSGLAIKRFAAFSSVTSIIYGVTNAITDAYQEFLLFNQEIVRLSQVTNKSVSDLQGISNEITRLSTSLGVTSSDLIVVASTLAQAGLSAQDTKIALEALAKSALAPSFENITDTTEGAIAAIRQFGLQTSQLESALGSINAVSAAFAVEAGDIIAAIQRTGGVFASASRGVSEGTDSLNEFIAIFTSVRQTTRESAETIATGLRTIFTRIQRSSTIELLKQYGVELRDLEGKFVGPYEAVRRLSEGLSKIDPRSADFARISEELGGFRQIGKVIPLIQQFSVAQDALNVAQKGSGSLTKDVQIAQQSLAVQFEKTRQNFLALVREVGDSTSFKVFVSSTLILTNAFIDLGRTLKPLLPLLLTFTAIKAGSGLNQFISGFGLAFNRGGGGPTGGGTGGGGSGGGGGGGSGGNQPLTSALTLNTTSNNALNTTLATLNTSILALNQNIVNTNSLLLNRPTRGFASGGLVPGSGNSDSVRANLTPGEFVLRKRAVESIGADNLARMNSGGFVRKYAVGSTSGVKSLTDNEVLSLLESSGIPRTIAGKSRPVTASELLRVDPSKQGPVLKKLSSSTGLPIDQLQRAASSVQSKAIQTKELSAQEKRRQLVTEKLEKRSAVQQNRVLDFGLVGLRYGTSKRDQDSISNFSFPAPPGFQDKKYNISKAKEDSDAFIRIKSATVSEKLQSGTAQQIQNELLDSFKTSVINSAKKISQGKTGIDESLVDAAVNNAEFYNVIGSGLEAAIGLLGAPIIPKTQDTKGIDFPQGLGSAAEIFGAKFRDIPTDVTRTIGGEGKGIASYRGQIVRWLSSQEGRDYLSKFSNIKKFAFGGSVSSEDTVPALLTPGEFVFNKDSAKKIGYGNLNRLNKADKIQGFNKGGVVGSQKFAVGGAVISDPAAIVAALTGILIPQVQRLAESFSSLQGDIGTFGTALGGIIRETSSVLLSTSIGLRAVGASESTVRRAQIGGGIGAAIGGGITDVSTKLLNKELDKNTQAISKFEKSLQDYANAPTEELKIEAAKKAEQNFLSLSSTIERTKNNIDQLENIKNFGQSINNVTLTILTTVTAMTALAAASRQASLAVVASKSAGAFVTGAAAISTSTKLLAKFGSLIPGIGTFIGLLSIGAEAFSFFSTKLNSTDEQFERLNSALRETINISNDYNLANENFINNILPQFRDLVSQKPGQSTDIAREIGSLSENSLNLTRNFLIKQFANAEGLGIGPTENLNDVRTRIQGEPSLQKVLTSSIDKANQKYIKDGFAAAMKEQGLIDPAAIANKAQELGGFDSKAVIQIAKDYFGELDRRLLAERDLADATRSLKVNMVNLTNTVSNLQSIYSRTFSDLDISFKDLNNNLDLLVGDIKIQTSTVLEKNIQILENLKQSTPQEISKALQNLRPSSGVIDNFTSPETKIFGEMTSAVQANAVLQQRTDFVLNKIAQLGLQGDQAKVLLNEELKGLLVSSIGGSDAETKAEILINELAGAIQKGGVEGKPITTFQEASSQVEGFGTLLTQLGETTKAAIDIAKIRQNAEQQLVDALNRELELRSKFTELTIQRQQTEIKNNIALKKILGQRVSLETINEEFLSQIRILTKGTPGISLQGGQILPDEVSAIAAELSKAKAEIADKRKKRDETGNIALTTDESFKQLVDRANNLEKALNLVAESGDLVNNTFEEIGKQKDLLKTRDQLLIDLITGAGDPTKAGQQKAIVEAILAVQAGNATMRQANLALEQGLPMVTAMRGEEAASVFRENATNMFLEEVKRLGTAEQKLAAELVLAKRAVDRADVAKRAQTAMESVKVAQEAQMDPYVKAINKSMEDTRTIFDNFNNDIRTRFLSLLETLNGIENRAQEQVKILPTQQIPENLRASIINAVNGLVGTAAMQGIPKIGGFEDPLAKIAIQELQRRENQLAKEEQRQPKDVRPVVRSIIPPLLNEAQAGIVKSLITEGTKKSLDEARSIIIQAARKSQEPTLGQRLLFATPSTEEIKFQEKRIMETVRLFNDAIDALFQPPKASAKPVSEQLNLGPAFNQGSFLDPASQRTLEGFSTTTKDLTTALTGENNSITRLADAVNSLAPVINIFKTAAESLAGKIGPDGTITINQTAQSNVSISFDEALQVDVPNNRGNTAIVDNIRSIIEEKISGLKREIGIV